MTNPIERPKSRLADFTADSRFFDKLLELIDDEMTSMIDDCIDAPEYDTPDYDAALTDFYSMLRERIAPIIPE